MPQVQFIDRPGIGAALGDFGSNFLESYQSKRGEVREDDAVQQLINSIGEDDNEFDIVKKISALKNVSGDRKQSLSQMLTGAKSKVEDRRYKKDEEKRKIFLQKKKNEIVSKANRGEEVTEEEISMLTPQEQNAIKQKPPSLSEYDKVRQREGAKEVTKLESFASDLKGSLTELTELDNLIKSTSGFGSLNLFDQAKLSTLSAASLKPIIKIYNPTGQLSKQKLEWINDRFGMGPLTPNAIQRGKAAGIRSMMEEQFKRTNERIALYAQYDGNPPPQVVRQFDENSERIYDEISGWTKVESEKERFKEVSSEVSNKLGDPSKFPEGKILKTKDGKTSYKVVNGKWVQL